ncbi:hypothetical protein ACFL2Q_10160 [Thermodesulfobacteriota bacterium]
MKIKLKLGPSAYGERIGDYAPFRDTPGGVCPLAQELSTPVLKYGRIRNGPARCRRYE